MNDEQLREAFARGLPAGDRAATLDDLEAERLRRLVEREGPEGERLHTLDRQLSTAAGRQELEIAWAAQRASRPARGRAASMARIAAAALVVVALGGAWWLARTPAQVLRGSPSPIALVAPVGAAGVGAQPRFVWRSLGGAERYTLVVVDSVGNEVFASETRDTAVTLPDSVHLEAGMTYLWWVQARTRSGAAVTAVTEKFQLAP